ncbi:MAG TPA: maleylpyruvate isomerase N-terminal domain-containing protein [bacterium]|nr:maleylpyruvate isomerase N-terminal domain-containing protein [bacterium]
MAARAEWVAKNAEERRRLASLITHLTPEQLALALPNGWTVATALVHLAFWDLRQAALLRRFVEEGVKPGSLDAEAVNEPLSQIAEILPPEAAVALALDAAETTDQAVADLTEDQVEALRQLGFERNLKRYLHRQNHLDKIEKVLKPGGAKGA